MKPMAAIITGIIFGLGLTISGMADPKNVLAFLTLNSQWNPNLMLVMASATSVTALGYFIVKKRSAPLFASSFMEPANTKIDTRLIAGATLFGFGWGLAGYCPGPAIVGAFQLDVRALAFFATFLVGLFVYEFFQSYLIRHKQAVTADG